MTEINPEFKSLCDRAERFEDWIEAFAACRERDKPILVRVENEIATIFPSGAGKTHIVMPK